MRSAAIFPLSPTASCTGIRTHERVFHMNIKVLVADDEQIICEVVKLYLELEGFTVYTAYDGEQALTIAEKHQPDLLLLDIMLPKVSGWEVCKNIQYPVYIIFMTARSLEKDKVTGFLLGANDYIIKPFSPRELVTRVKTVLRGVGISEYQ